MRLTNRTDTSGKGDILLPAGPAAPLGGVALYRAQSGASRFGLGAELWPWSSAACHCGAKEQDEHLTLEPWRSHWTNTTWQEHLSAGETEARLAVIRQRTHTGRPLGTEEFIQDLEKVTQRRKALQKRGPREKIVTDRRQGELTFDP